VSASDYSQCPRCLRRHREKVEHLTQQLAEAYGKLGHDEYEALAGKLSEARDSTPMDDMREDWEFHGIATGTLHIDYGAVCQTCGLEVVYTATKVIDSSEEA
jgi:hypothetical protein